MKKPVILDVDTGVDDAIAILFASMLPELDIRAITTVSGNVHVKEVFRNTKTVLGLIPGGDKIPLGLGAAVSLRRTNFFAPEVHGADGLGNIRKKYERLSVASKPIPAAQLILETIKRSDKPVSIIATGPLTNIAWAIKQNLRRMKLVKEIVSMGGAFETRGNTGPLAEFNYYVDPDAVETVADSGIPLTIVPLDATHRVVLTRAEVLQWSRRSESIQLRFLRDVTQFYMRYHRATESFYGGFMHDPLAVGIAAIPRLARYKTLPLLIETKGEYASGTTLTRDAAGSERHAPKVRIVSEVDARRFKTIFKNHFLGRSGIKSG